MWLQIVTIILAALIVAYFWLKKYFSYFEEIGFPYVPG
jgi:hypothetical protein